MKQPHFIFMLALFPAFYISSCTSVKKDQLILTRCDTANISYANDIVPILRNNCYTCHSEQNKVESGGLILEGHGPLAFWAAGGTNSILVGVISHKQGFIPMPYLEPKMDSCSINKIVAWVIAGTPDN